MTWMDLWLAQACPNLDAWAALLNGDLPVLLNDVQVDSDNQGAYWPLGGQVFRSLQTVAPADVRVVIVGQDPYHDGSANGLAFSVDVGHPIPPALRTILAQPPMIGVDAVHGDLSQWAAQGVLLLNRVLTVGHGQANSHRSHGWEEFTHSILLRLLAMRPQEIVVLLWGKRAQSLVGAGEPRALEIRRSSHPSPNFGACNNPLAAVDGGAPYPAFTVADHFEQVNQTLAQHGFEPINWLAPWVVPG